MLNVLAIGDLHEPFAHKQALEFVRYVDRYCFNRKDRKVVFLGDEIDAHSMGRWPADPDGLSPGHELHEARLRMSYWFDEFPDAYVCESNHTYRPWKKAFHAGIPKEFMRSVGEVLKAPIGWKWAEKWIIDDVVFEHGENVSGPLGALRASEQNRKSTVIGHLHSFGGVIQSDSFHDRIWGMNVGCLIDLNAYAFSYGKTFRKKPSLGVGVIRNDTPFFVPMILNEHGHWRGYL